MNMPRLYFPALALAAASVHASPFTVPAPLDPVHVGTRLVVDCRAERLPPLRAIGAVLDTNNASRIYAERERLMRAAHRECLRGAAYVMFVRDADPSFPVLAAVVE